MTDTVLTQSLTLAAESGEVHRSLLQYILKGGPIGMIIILISLVAIGMIGAQLFRIRRERLAPPDLLADLRSLLGDGNIDGAIKRCSDEPGSSYLARVVGTGLTRASRSAFGMLELRSSVDEIGQLEVDRLYRLTDGIGLIASVAPMLGLLGTVVGMVGAFDAITLSDGPARRAGRQHFSGTHHHRARADRCHPVYRDVHLPAQPDRSPDHRDRRADRGDHLATRSSGRE
mgnify:CR=1 FL=1